ncbi:MAG: efflux RND transporter periplasmic adaptor subunit, partial [Bryobacteraceae bacterium]|nr:efflux RND transporter periplasmic adaptor subunit [Bryobacteraceae bacterium]
MRSETILLGFALLLLASCNGRNPETTEARSPSVESEEKAKPGEVLLTRESQEAGGIAVQTISPARLNETIAATGQITVNEDQTFTVGALLDGRVVSVAARVGDRVAKGQVLARIHSHEVHDARAAYKVAELELMRTRSALIYAERIRDRASRLLEIRAGSRQELDTAEAELRNAKTMVSNAEVNVAKERTHIVEFLDIPVEDDDSKPDKADDFVPVRAPANGLVIDRKVTPGTVVATGSDLFRITTTNSVWMIANVNETDLSQVKPGMPVRVLVRAFPE